MILLAGLVFLLAGGIGVRQDRRLTRTGQRVTGTVTDLRVRLTDNDGGRTSTTRVAPAGP